MSRTTLVILQPLIVFSALTCAGASAGASAADDLTTQVQGCQQIGSDADRLRCYDALLLQPSVSENVTSPAAPTPTSTAPLPARPKMPILAAPPPAPPVAAPVASASRFPKQATIDRVTKTIDNRKIFYLDDGSIWRETRTSRNNYTPGVVATVEVSGVFGQKNWKRYRMEIDGRSFSVIEITSEE